MTGSSEIELSPQGDGQSPSQNLDPNGQELSDESFPKREEEKDRSAGDPPADLDHATLLPRITLALETIAEGYQDEAKERRQAEITRALLESSCKLAEQVVQLGEQSAQAFIHLYKVAAPDTLIRMSESPSGALGSIHKILSPIKNKLEVLNVLVASCKSFLEQSGRITQLIDGSDRSEAIEYGRSTIANFVKMLVKTDGVLTLSESDVRTSTNALARIKTLQSAYFAASSRSGDALPFLFRSDPEIDEIEHKIPMTQEKPLVSLALVDLAKSLPSKKILEECDSQTLLDAALRPFERVRTVLTDPQLLVNLLQDSVTPNLVAAMDEVERIEKEIRNIVEESKIEEAVAEAFADGTRAFREFFQAAEDIEAGRSLTPKGSQRSSLELRRALDDGKLELTNFEPATASPTHGAMLTLYQELSDIIFANERQSVKLDRIKVEELVAIRDAALKGGGTFSRVKRLMKDNSRGNYSFELVGSGSGMALRQVPTSGVSFDQLMGGSWRKIEDRVQRLLRYDKRRLLYSDLSVRGKANNNMLIVGPYGMGKNFFVRALANQKELIVIHGSTDKLLSKWLGEAEQNVRRVFEVGAETYDKYEKPVILVLDEIDSFFMGEDEHRGSGTHHSIVGMQKTLQSVLDGDIIYEGVSLVGLTNEPAKVPVPIFRRFGAVEIIEAFQPEERRALLESMAAQLPMQEGWKKEFDWDGFDGETKFASGDQIGKIYDEAFEYVLNKVDRMGEKGFELLDRVTEMVEEHGRLTPGQRSEIWNQALPDLKISGRELSEISRSLLERPEHRLARQQQESFYESLDDRFGEAFGGDT